jgi:CheY-like chemotaxis protein
MIEMIAPEKKILIIDPVDTDRKIMAHFLRSHGYHVETGKGLADAIEKISDSSFVCITLDVDIPEMKGYEAVSILKNLFPQIKIIMTTKKNTKRLEAKVREQNIFYYFIKSFDKEELKLVINNALMTKGGNNG